MDLLKALLAHQAEQIGVAQELLATTSDLNAIVRSQALGEALDTSPLCQGWRGELLGDNVKRLLRGELALAMDPKTRALQLRPA